MILADKIIHLRKRNGWTQEELADKLNVSRQAVSKWEGAQSIPDMDKILQMSRLFEVSVDYLLKEELTESDYVEDTSSNIRKITVEFANSFLKDTVAHAKQVALGVILFILSPVVLVTLSLFSEASLHSLTDNQYSMLGVITLIVMVVIGVGILIATSSKMARYDFLEDEVFDIQFGVEGLAIDAKARYKDTRTKGLIFGVSILILSVIPVLLSNVFDIFNTLGVPMLLIMVGIGVYILIRVSIRWSSYEKLLQEGEYNPRTKEKNDIIGTVAGIYWPLVVAGYLLWSFVGSAWDISWIVFPIAGILFGAIATLLNYFKS